MAELDGAAEQAPINGTIRVVLVDDHLAFRQSLAFMLLREPDITIRGQAGTVAEARHLLPEADIALIDLHLPDEDGMVLIHDLHSLAPQVIAVLLTGDDSTAAMARAVNAGAAGVLHKSRPVSEVVAAIRRLHAGEPLVSLRESIELLRLSDRQREQDRAVHAKIDRLTPRERDVLHALALGLSDHEMAEHLLVCTETVRTHMVNLLRKLEVDSRLKALIFAVRHHLVSLDAPGPGAPAASATAS